MFDFLGEYVRMLKLKPLNSCKDFEIRVAFLDYLVLGDFK